MSLARPAALPVVALLWAETRPVVQAIFALRYWTGAALGAAGSGQLRPAVVVGAVAWLLLTMSIYLINGVSDLTADRANGSARPLARGWVSESGAVRTAWALGIGGLLLAAATGVPAVGVCAVAMGVLGWLYSVGPRPLKCSVAGTAVASAGGGLLSYAVGSAAAGGVAGAGYLALFGLLSGLMAVAGAAKDLGDVAGDRAAGRRTLPVVVGHRTATRVIAGGCLVLAAAALVTAGREPEVLLPAVLLALGACAVAGWALVTPGDAARPLMRRPYRAFMVTQYAVNPALLLSVLL